MQISLPNLLLGAWLGRVVAGDEASHWDYLDVCGPSFYRHSAHAQYAMHPADSNATPLSESHLSLMAPGGTNRQKYSCQWFDAEQSSDPSGDCMIIDDQFALIPPGLAPFCKHTPLRHDIDSGYL
jgi:hypothetical protein